MQVNEMIKELDLSFLGTYAAMEHVKFYLCILCIFEKMSVGVISEDRSGQFMASYFK